MEAYKVKSCVVHMRRKSHVDRAWFICMQVKWNVNAITRAICKRATRVGIVIDENGARISRECTRYVSINNYNCVRFDVKRANLYNSSNGQRKGFVESVLMTIGKVLLSWRNWKRFAAVIKVNCFYTYGEIMEGFIVCLNSRSSCCVLLLTVKCNLCQQNA